MPKVTFNLLGDGKKFSVDACSGTSILDIALQNGIHIDHACEKACACTTCQVFVTSGLNSLNDSSDTEEDMLDKAWGVQHNSRLSCQILLSEEDVDVEVPKYTINLASEQH